ncbi:unnamed protein product [Discula destructiva]
MSNFKVIVVGGGPAGLVAAHALSKAGIDYTVLEAQPVIAKDVGASLVMQTYSLRALSQLGLLEKLLDKGHEVLRWAEFTKDKLVSESYPVEHFKKDFGMVGMMYHRAELVQLIYDGLPDDDKARVHLNKKVADIDTNEDGVVVTCTDGSTHSGSIVVGADGVHSRVRAFMREQMLKEAPDSDQVDGSQPYPSEYKTLWCSFPRRYEFAPGDHCITHGDGASLQFLNASKRSWVFVYEKLDKPQTERVRYTDKDLEAFAERHGDLTVGHRLQLKDVIKHRTAGGLTNLEEGIVKNWSHGRLVLVGDACHKFTPNAGAGLNNGIQDVIALVNELHALSKLRGPPPSLVELTAAFGRYREARAKMVQADYNLSRHTTRLCAWPNTTYWFVDQWVLPYFPWCDHLIRQYLVYPNVRDTLVFDFIEGEEPFVGDIPWNHPIKKPQSIS